MACRNTGRHSLGSTPRGRRVSADNTHCYQSHYRSSAPGTPNLSRKSDWSPIGAHGSHSHSHYVPHIGRHAAQSHPHTDIPPGTAGDTALRDHPGWCMSRGRRSCTHQNDCSLDKEELKQKVRHCERECSTSKFAILL